MRRFLWLVLSSLLGASEYDDLVFDVEAFEKKSWEIQGYLRSDNTALKGARIEKYSTSDELNAQTNYRTSWLNLHADASLFYRDDSITRSKECNATLNALTQRFGDEKISLEVGKKVARFGKGYSYTALSFFEREKDRLYPELSRQGFWIIEGAATKTFAQGALKNSTLTLIALPDVTENAPLLDQTHSRYGAKAYLLWHDIDIDLIVAEQSYGADISFNPLPQLELHAEYGVRVDETSYLLGFRYQSASDATIIAEYVQTFDQGVFYYLRASQKEPFRIVYTSAYGLTTYDVDTKNSRTLLGATYDFKNNLLLDVAWLAATQGNGAKIIANYYF